MRNKKTLLVIAAVAMILVAVSTAYATWHYCEQWPLPMGTTASGYIQYNNRRYDASSGSGQHWCREGQGTGGNDLFPTDSADWSATFIWDSSGVKDTISLVSQDYSTHTNSGEKQTGQTGTKEGAGYWCGYDSNKGVYFWGTWDTGDNNDSYYFDYGIDGTKNPPTVSVQWDADESSDENCSGGGGTGSGNRASNVAQCFQ